MTAPSQSFLNGPQLQAVTHPGGPLLVLAGPGTGKTRVLVHRLAWLLGQGVPPQSLLLLTFTRRAARDMIRRAAELAGQSMSKIECGTFHSVASRILRKHGWHVGIKPGFVVIGQSDSESIIRQVKPACRTRTQPTPSQILSVLSAADNNSIPFYSAAMRKCSQHCDYPFEAIAQAYADYKAAHGYMDYDDLLLGLLALLMHPVAAEKISGQFQHVLVDEYQDVNHLQSEAVRLLASVHGNVTAVGDEAQGIYSFRGAEISNILSFEQTFPGPSVVRLEQNYRSRKPVLDFANAVIDKRLFTTLSGGSLPVIHAAFDEQAEAEFVAARIRKLLASGVPPAEIAVLAAASDTFKPLEIELKFHRIPYEKRGGSKLTDSEHVRGFLAYFRLLANPSDTLAWSLVLEHIDHVGAKTAAKVINFCLGHEDPLDALKYYHPAPSWLPGHFDLVALLRKCAGLSPAEVFELVYAYYEPLLFRKHPDDHSRRCADIEFFRPWASSSLSLRAFVEDMALDLPLSSAPQPGGVILSTVHSGKGLEFSHVFVVGLVEGRFPRHCSTAAQRDEQRRLFFVAVTRAREGLCCTWPARMKNSDGKPACSVMSPFLRISSNLYKAASQ